jgi:hypothetical protein
MKNEGIHKMKPADLHKDYSCYCLNNSMKPIGKNDFILTLKKIGIVSKKISLHYYFITYDELKAISDKRCWVCEYDTPEDDDEDVNDAFIDNGLDHGLDPVIDYKKLYFDLLNKK